MNLPLIALSVVVMALLSISISCAVFVALEVVYRLSRPFPLKARQGKPKHTGGAK